MNKSQESPERRWGRVSNLKSRLCEIASRIVRWNIPVRKGQSLINRPRGRTSHSPAAIYFSFRLFFVAKFRSGSLTTDLYLKVTIQPNWSVGKWDSLWRYTDRRLSPITKEWRSHTFDCSVGFHRWVSCACFVSLHLTCFSVFERLNSFD